MDTSVYNIGDLIWYAHCDWRQVERTRDVCFGKLQVTLVLGNGESVVLPCEYCGKGHEGPRGIVEDWEYDNRPEQLTITRINTETEGGQNNSQILCWVSTP